jgi:sulfate permease, SulP family
MVKKSELVGEFWGGLAAMLVAVPSAIAFGVTIYGPLGAGYAAQGAIAGILGTVALGLVAPALGGTRRLITAPCAPAAAVLAALALQLTEQDVAPERALALIALTGLLCGALQLIFGALRFGRLIKYMPYPVVSGYLSGVGLVIIVSQLPLLLAAPKEASFWQALAAPESWGWRSLVIGGVTIAATIFAGKLIRAVPAAILGLGAGVLAYLCLAIFDPALLQAEGNALVIGPLGASQGGLFDGAAGVWSGIATLTAADLALILMPAATLAVLLSIDTLKTCVVLDAVTRTRHDSNRELLGQGTANLVANAIGGMPGAGQMGATLVNMSSGGRTRLSGSIEGVLALFAFLLVADLVAFVPIAALAGILLIVGFRMIDWKSLHFVRSRATMLDFAVIIAVIVTAKTVSLIAASGVGIALAVMLFVRGQISSSIVHRRSTARQNFSKQVRLPEEMAVLQEHGEETAIFELRGSLFFGTADQLYRAVEPDLKTRRTIILDMRLVRSVDVTAVHVLEQLEDMMKERGGELVFSTLPRFPTGQEMQDYFDQVGLVQPGRQAHAFNELDDALEWVESRVLAEAGVGRAEESLLSLRDIDIFKARRDDTLADLEAHMKAVSIKAGERLFGFGDASDELYLIRRGAIRIMQPLAHDHAHHLATFNRGDFFGEMSFLDHQPRSADAYAERDSELYVLSRASFEDFALGHKKGAMNLFEGLAKTLAERLRYTNTELRQLEES